MPFGIASDVASALRLLQKRAWHAIGTRCVFSRRSAIAKFTIELPRTWKQVPFWSHVRDTTAGGGYSRGKQTLVRKTIDFISHRVIAYWRRAARKATMAALVIRNGKGSDPVVLGNREKTAGSTRELGSIDLADRCEMKVPDQAF